MKFNILNLFFPSPYDTLEPVEVMPPISFSFKKTKNVSDKNRVVPPDGFKEIITEGGIKFAKNENMDDGLTVEFKDLKDKMLHESELTAIIQKYQGVKKDAVVIAKKCYAKNMTVPQTIVELKKFKLEYGQTYIKFFFSVFKEFDKKMGERKPNAPTLIGELEEKG
jgi:hypothetical protein